MMFSKLSLMFVFCFLNTGCSEKTTDMPTIDNAEHNEFAMSSSRDELTLDKNTFEKNKKLAESGDLTAARKLYEHYIVGLNDAAKALPWMEIIAKRGDISAQRSLAFDYMALGGIDNCAKFRYWVSIIFESQTLNHRSNTSKDIDLILNKEYQNCLEDKKWWGKELEDSIQSIKNASVNKGDKAH